VTKAILFAAALLALPGCSGVLEVSSSTSGAPGGGGGGPVSVTAPATVSGGDDVVTPDLMGKTREEAQALVRAAGFLHEVESTRPLACEDAEQIEGKINCQAPAPGAVVKKYVLVQINVHTPTRIGGAIVRAQLFALLGKTPDEAKALLQSYGHDGKVTVRRGDPMVHDYSKCEEGVVCWFNASESGISVHDDITLYTKPRQKASE
jgi:hypothetical protein